MSERLRRVSGIVPVSLLYDRVSSTKRVFFAISDGIVPERELSRNEICSIAPEPISVGIVPEMLLK
jgi:hypothetical protein